ncbi:C25 family cysteine peptidase [Candidatus Eisenbacteria bacterium]|uniref:C25 family cysteine peptidase n=1 Tax=Eiseniibacteriota bacterium TaxID=2212470 RepID=A0ABV6YIP2_UNCEI
MKARVCGLFVFVVGCAFGFIVSAEARTGLRGGESGQSPSVVHALVGPHHESHAPTEDLLLTFPEEASGTEVIIQLSVPDLQVDERFADGQTFHAIRLRGYGHTSSPGAPQMPVKALFLAVPEGATIETELLDTETVSRTGLNIYPVPRPVARETYWDALRTAEEFCLDKAAYASFDFYPEKSVEVGWYGYLRDIRVVQLKVSPVQYLAASNELLIHKRLKFRVHLTGGRFPSQKATKDRRVSGVDPFDRVFDNLLLNYNPALKGTSRPGKSLETAPADLRYLRNRPFKVSVEEEGIYEITRQDLADARADLCGVDPRTLKVFHLGEEIPIHVSGEEDGTFDADDRIEFFGRDSTSEYSVSDIHWLSWGGDPGLRMERRDASPGDSLPIPASFLRELHFEEDHRYYSNVHQGEGKDHWFWEQLTAPCTGEYPLTLPDVSTSSSEVKMRINLRGKTASPHHTQVLLNGNLVADLRWEGMIELESDFTCPHVYLHGGANELTIACPSTSVDQIFFNWFEIQYQRDFAAHEDVLRFSDAEPGPAQFEIAGFSSPQIEVYQILDPTHVAKLAGLSIVPAGQAYSVVFEDNPGQGEFVAINSGRKMRPAFIARDEASFLHSSARGADYIIITHEEFYDSVQPLKGLRESDGLRVAVIDVEDVYDEFAYGNVDPNALKAFLAFAYDNWQPPAPTYVLLVGDASFDYKGNQPTANVNYVPTHLFVSQSDDVEVSSDDWFVCLAGDDLIPDMLIGRLSGQTQSDVEGLVRKIVDYETAIEPGDWRQRALLIADDSDEGGDFEAVCDGFAEDYLAPAGFDVSTVYVRECLPACRSHIVESINDGCSIISFVGHGSVDQWAEEQVVESADISTLSNKDRLPLILAFTCLNGYFHHAVDDFCLAEEFHRAPDGGALACWAHSGLNYTTPSQTIGDNLYEALVTDGNHILGSAVCQAKMAYLGTSPYFWDQAPMLILFGDPALEMGFDGRPDLLPGTLTFQPTSPRAGGADTLTATIFNAGRVAASAISTRFFNGHPDSSSSTRIADLVVPHLAPGEGAGVSVTWDSLPAPGTHRIFVQVDADDHLIESAEWNNLTWGSLHVRAQGGVEDSIPPAVKLLIDGKVVGTEFMDFDYVSSHPEIEMILTDAGSGIELDALSVTMNGKPLRNLSVQEEGAASDSIVVTCFPGMLTDGTHTLCVRVRDRGSNPNTTEARLTFVAESQLRIRDLRNHPNPMRAETRFVYRLSQNADNIEIRIYSVTGELVRTIAPCPACRNRNTVVWNGTDDDGERMTSGEYFYRIVGTAGRESGSGSGKLVIIR